MRRMLLLAVVFLAGCAGRLITPIAASSPLPPVSVYASLGDFLAAHGCRQAVSLVGPSLTRTYTTWNPAVPLQGGAGFAASFTARYGIAFADRRSPVEVETLSEAFNALSAFLAQGNAAALGLPAGYQITEQDKADLFYVAGPGRGLAFREVLLPLIEPPSLPPPPTEPPVCPPLPPPCPPANDCPACPACPDPVPLPCAPVACSPVPCAPVPLALSAKGNATVELMVTWRTIGSGRRQMLRELAAELKKLQVKP